MNPSALFIHRPVATILLMVAILLSGMLAYRLLPVSALPQVDYPTIQVTTFYPGASPEVMTSSVTAPLERQFGQMPGLAQMTSASSSGVSVITLRFELTLPLDVAEQQVQAAMNAASNLLPNDLPMPPVYSKVNPADTPVLTLAITSDTLPLPVVEDLVNTRVAQKISQVQGVGLVTIAGGQRPAVRVQVNPTALAALGLSIEDVRTAIASANVNGPQGSFDGPLQASTIDTNGQLRSANEYRQIILAYRDGAPIRLTDVADIIDSAENTQLAAWANLQPAILLNIQRQPGANVIDVVDRIKQLLPRLQESLPGSVDVTILTDRTTTIRASVADVQKELLFAVALVIMVIFIFLRNLSATLIPAAAVPLSLIGTFGIMYLAGFSLNNLTLMALTIATGFVVDDAIVMIENIMRYIEQGESPMSAALKGSRQIGFTIISLTFSLIAVLIPLLFMGDIVGRLFREFAVTLAVSILISAFVSLTLTPMMCARLLHHIPEEKMGRFHIATGRFFDAIITHYSQALTWVLEREKTTLIVAIGTLLLTILLYLFIPKGFFPVQDTGVIQGITEAAHSISFAAMAEKQQAVAQAILKDPAVASLSSFIGVDGTNATLNTGRLLINLTPHAARDEHAQTVIERLQRATAHLGGVSLYLQPVQDLTIEDRIARTQYQFTVEDPDSEKLALWVPRLVQRLQQEPLLRDVTSDQQNNGLRVYVDIDRDAAARFGITPAAIDNALYSAYGQRMISTIFTQAAQYRVILETQPDFRTSPSSIEALRLPSASGEQIPFAAFAHITTTTGPLSINHQGQFPVATISFNLAPGASLGAAVDAINTVQAELELPGSIQVAFQGAALAFHASLSSTLWLIIAAIITMYIVLGVLYESAIHPVTILSTLPSAGIGALLGLFLSQRDLDIIAIIGIILLIGIVKKNAIMMIDFALEAEREQGMTPRDAIFQACQLRFRPILMTTLAALLSALPLMLGTGVGSELRQPLGITMVGGLLVSQVLTLFTTPVIYLTFDRVAQNVKAGYRKHFGSPDDDLAPPSSSASTQP